MKTETVEEFQKRGGVVRRLHMGDAKFNPKKKFPMRNMKPENKVIVRKGNGNGSEETSNN